MKRREIDPVMAVRLHECGCSWDDVGRILAIQRHRRSPFHGRSVWLAVRAYDRRATSEDEANSLRRIAPPAPP